MIGEPEVVLAASPRDWGQRLHRFVADHGGARVRATILRPEDALTEHYQVLVADDTTSFLTPRLVSELRIRGRRVLGVYDPDDTAGKGELVALGVDAVIARDAPAQEFVDSVRSLTAVAPRLIAPAGPAPGEQPTRSPVPPGRVTVVASPCGGCGATEVAIALAAVFGRSGEDCVLVDADEVAASVAQRLGLPLYPNLRAAVDAVEQEGPALDDLLLPVDGEAFRVLPGLSTPRDWSMLRAPEAVHTIRTVAEGGRHVVVNAGHRVEDLTRGGGPARYALSRLVLGAADTLVSVGLATPVALARLVEWVADVRALAADTPLHVVMNRAPGAAFKRSEVADELGRALLPASLAFLPSDPRVEVAAWAATVPRRGPFARAVAATAAGLPRTAPAGRPGGGGRHARRGPVRSSPEAPRGP